MFPTTKRWRTLFVLNAAGSLLAGIFTIEQTRNWHFAWYETGAYFFLQWLMVLFVCLIVAEFIEFLGEF
jgi:hypothetical protein